MFSLEIVLLPSINIKETRFIFIMQLGYPKLEQRRLNHDSLKRTIQLMTLSQLHLFILPNVLEMAALFLSIELCSPAQVSNCRADHIRADRNCIILIT
jgi:hypothetical protein